MNRNFGSRTVRGVVLAGLVVALIVAIPVVTLWAGRDRAGANQSETVDALGLLPRTRSGSAPSATSAPPRLPSINFSEYQGILIAPETGQDGNWGDPGCAWANVVQSSGLPVIGRGEGGFNFFGKIGLAIGWPNGLGTNTQDIIALNTNDSIWQTPYPISIPADNMVQVYNNASEAIFCLMQPPFPGNIQAYGQWPAIANQYPIIRQDSRYLLWGFRNTPFEFTPSGEALFGNFLDALTKP